MRFVRATGKRFRAFPEKMLTAEVLIFTLRESMKGA
jgi:hypothetical protein